MKLLLNNHLHFILSCILPLLSFAVFITSFQYEFFAICLLGLAFAIGVPAVFSTIFNAIKQRAWKPLLIGLFEGAILAYWLLMSIQVVAIALCDT